MTKEQFEQAQKIRRNIEDYEYLIESLTTTRIKSVVFMNGGYIENIPRGKIKDAMVAHYQQCIVELEKRFEQVGTGIDYSDINPQSSILNPEQ